MGYAQPRTPHAIFIYLINFCIYVCMHAFIYFSAKGTRLLKAEILRKEKKTCLGRSRCGLANWEHVLQTGCIESLDGYRQAWKRKAASRGSLVTSVKRLPINCQKLLWTDTCLFVYLLTNLFVRYKNARNFGQ